jgi:hypothetical protein
MSKLEGIFYNVSENDHLNAVEKWKCLMIFDYLRHNFDGDEVKMK